MLINARRSLAGSIIGKIQQTHKMLDFAVNTTSVMTKYPYSESK
jgi:D-arabinose 1-dehydrogenase-like Zn-dependent alcohol dehydrogenase